MNNNSFYCVIKNAGLDECVRLACSARMRICHRRRFAPSKTDVEKNNTKETTVLRSYLQSERK